MGNWVQDLTGPFYTNATCSSIEDHQNCMRNGRPDTDYVYWRWKPRDCNLPRFDPKRFLNMMRGKSLAFIGDSIMRNHVQSLLCILSQVPCTFKCSIDDSFLYCCCTSITIRFLLIFVIVILKVVYWSLSKVLFIPDQMNAEIVALLYFSEKSWPARKKCDQGFDSLS